MVNSSTQTISGLALPTLIQAASSIGLDGKIACKEVGLTPQLVNSQQSRVRIDLFEAFIEALAKQSDMPDICLHLGNAFSFENFGPIKTFIFSSETLGDALQLCEKLQAVVKAPGQLIRFEELSKIAYLQILPYGPSGPIDRSLAELFLSVSFNTLSDLLPSAQIVKEVHFKHKDAKLGDCYQDFFNTKIKFGQDCNALILNKKALREPLSGSYPEIHEQAKEWLDNELHYNDKESEIVRSIYDSILTTRHPSKFTVEDFATQVATTPRTLQRHLQRANISFRDLKHAALLFLANEQLRHSSKSIEIIAEELGFSDRRSFSRAYLKWTGISPKSYRAQYKQP